MSFLRIDDIDPGEKYFGSFNALDSVKGGKIGDALLVEVLDKEGEDANIKAVCDSYEDISSFYINKHGFIGTRAYNEDNQPTFEIIKKKDRRKYYFDDLNKENIKEEYERFFSGNENKDQDNWTILKVSIIKNEKGYNENISLIDKKINELIINKNMVITKQIIDEREEEKDVYLCLEPI